ncbi:Uncharacterized protein DAT39_023060 [Clarias magur]|uniref:Uncharacterized protein n=1 Tax=Clarias magur TaxID=1594786 RepID=A0A8J4TLL7_CLAMG|nr:Uncharacterized protein DAT39_023060 [Clarias magur]
METENPRTHGTDTQDINKQTAQKASPRPAAAVWSHAPGETACTTCDHDYDHCNDQRASTALRTSLGSAMSIIANPVNPTAYTPCCAHSISSAII